MTFYELMTWMVNYQYNENLSFTRPHKTGQTDSTGNEVLSYDPQFLGIELTQCK